MLTIQDIYRARKVVYQHMSATPLYHYPALSALVGAEVWVKHENMTALGAFKMRGGLNLAAQLSDEQKSAGLASASTGNHGLSIANAGKTLGIPVTIAMPENSVPSKVAAMQNLGAKVVFHGADFDTARRWMIEQAAQTGMTWVPPTHPALIAGVGTYALEIIESLPDVEAILVPVGSGTGAVGCGVVAQALKPSVEVIAVQSAQAPAQYLAWHGRDWKDAPMTTFAEGIATRVAFEETQAVMRQTLADFVLVEDHLIKEAVRLYLEHAHTLVEGAGAASLAAALCYRERFAGKKIALVISGGNMAMSQLREIVQ